MFWIFREFLCFKQVYAYDDFKTIIKTGFLLSTEKILFWENNKNQLTNRKCLYIISLGRSAREYIFWTDDPNRSVAQLGRALRSGRRGRVFESRHFDWYWESQNSFQRILALFSFNKTMWKYGMLKTAYFLQQKRSAAFRQGSVRERYVMKKLFLLHDLS